MHWKDLQGNFTARVTVPAGWATAATVSTEPVFKVPFRASVKAARFLPSAAITGDDTNTATIFFKNKTGGDTVASLAFVTGEDAADMVEEALTLSATAADLILAAGDIIYVEKTAGGSGLAVSGVMEIDYVSDPV